MEHRWDSTWTCGQTPKERTVQPWLNTESRRYLGIFPVLGRVRNDMQGSRIDCTELCSWDRGRYLSHQRNELYADHRSRFTVRGLRILFLPLAYTFLMVGQSLAQVHVTNDTPDGSIHESQGPVSTADRGPRPDQSSAFFQTPSDWWKTPLNWETGAGRSYVIPGIEILAYMFLLNQYDRHFTEPKDVYRTTGNTFTQHVTDSKWVLDKDQFSVNQFLHPYGGSIYYGLARSAGLNFWESFLYSSAGSLLWELGGEKTAPSINDMIATPIGGAS